MEHPIAKLAGRRNLATVSWLTGIAFLVFGFCGSAVSDAQTANGTVSGHVLDPKGALIPGATVTLTETDTNVEMTTTSNGEGLYTFASVKPGEYRMKVSAPSFSTIAISGLTVAVQGSLSRDVVLKI